MIANSTLWIIAIGLFLTPILFSGTRLLFDEVGDKYLTKPIELSAYVPTKVTCYTEDQIKITTTYQHLDEDGEPVGEEFFGKSVFVQTIPFSRYAENLQKYKCYERNYSSVITREFEYIAGEVVDIEV